MGVVVYLCAGAYGQMRALDPVKLGLQAVVNCHRLGDGSKCRSLDGQRGISASKPCLQPSCCTSIILKMPL